MAQAKHTPGPWVVTDEHPNRSAVRVMHDYHEVAALYGPHGTQSQDVEGIWRNDDERMANARLIAAAPRMFDTLSDMDKWLENTGYGANHPWRISIRAAINEATGGAS